MDGLCKPRLVVLGGPTATGKTALSVALAKEFSGEILSADSMQLYRGLDIGTAKVTAEEMDGVPHHMLSFLDPAQSFSVADYTQLAGQKIREITAAGHLPFMVGGTGLYLSSLVNGVRFAEQKSNAALREQLHRQLAEQGAQAMHQQLDLLDPESARQIHPNNTGRVLRALELYRLTGKTMSQQKRESLPPEKPYRALVLCLTYPERAALYEKIDLRVEQMLESGLLEEAHLVWENRETYRTAAQAIGYKEFFPYFEGTASVGACTEKLKQASRNYAKRQLTWFGHMEDVVWLQAGAPDLLEAARAEIENFLAR